MKSTEFILPSNQRPSWLIYPPSYLRVVDQLLVNMTPWHIMDTQRTLMQRDGLKRRYPARDLFPFAYRQDNDDVACWERTEGERVLIVHDFASPGFEHEGSFNDFWSWFRSAIDETISWD